MGYIEAVLFGKKSKNTFGFLRPTAEIDFPFFLMSGLRNLRRQNFEGKFSVSPYFLCSNQCNNGTPILLEDKLFLRTLTVNIFIII